AAVSGARPWCVSASGVRSAIASITGGPMPSPTTTAPITARTTAPTSATSRAPTTATSRPASSTIPGGIPTMATASVGGADRAGNTTTGGVIGVGNTTAGGTAAVTTDRANWP